MPTSDKYEYKNLESDCHRIEMAHLATKGTGIAVSTLETDKGKWLETVKVIDEIKKEYPNNQILYLCGSDIVYNVHKDDEFNRYLDKLTKKCDIVVMERKGYVYTQEMLKDLGIADNVIQAPVDVPEISSTFVRDNINNPDTLIDHLHEPVIEYIKEHNLYV